LGNNPKKYEINGVNGFKLTIQDFAINYNFFQHDIVVDTIKQQIICIIY